MRTVHFTLLHYKNAICLRSKPSATRVSIFKPFMDLGLGPKGKISGMCHFGGAVVACSTDKSIKVGE